MPILLATSNRGKLKELSDMLGPLYEVIGLSHLESTEPIETGSTYAENALLKAQYFHVKTGLPTIADDSGLEVNYLGGEPGVLSARFAGTGVTDADRISVLLRKLVNVAAEDRVARFVCAAALVWNDSKHVFQGEVEGVLTTEPRGENGFGFDPIFFYEPSGKTFAEMSIREKSRVSHRARAFKQLTDYLLQSGLLDTMSRGDRIIEPKSEKPRLLL
jgi:XTP/dITP diphosphohydrolase